MGAYTIMVDWDEIFSVLRQVYPKLTKYGLPYAASTPKIVEFVQNAERLEDLAKQIFDIKITHGIETRAAFETIERANKKKSDAIRKLVEKFS